MSDIPYNYRKYIDDVTKMTQRGAISSGEQQASPSSAGSRGLAKTMQFTNNPTQMQLGQEAIAESMVEIRSIINRIDGVNAPVQEDDESYGYEWECSNCGTENQFDMTPQERAQYIKDWEEDNQDLVADGETGLVCGIVHWCKARPQTISLMFCANTIKKEKERRPVRNGDYFFNCL